ncbi:ABC transporter ATP-binding protein [Caproicibacterium lactatifermentans]|jgi:putative ABC transport system ATP-binding protein|uniref:ABC transporter ATP-binding protein n=1 Tax=Caproicibacterium lactatifermentans TaxID=2666138 RepID=UPI003D942F70
MSQLTAPEAKPLVRMEHIYKTFNPGSVNEVVLFQDFNLQIAEGSFVAVVGSNGSGKTTILNLLCGSLPLGSGEIYVGDRQVTKMKEYERSRFIGRVFQDPSMGTCPSLTVLENMALADNKGSSFLLQRGVNRRRTQHYREELSLLHMGLEDKLGVQVGSLSGGQRQALAMLIATMSPINLLILDEHTAALDPHSSENVMELTQRVAKEKHVTMLMVTHNLKFAVAYGDRLLMMHRGHIMLDAAGEDKKVLDVRDLTNRFDEISVEDGN